ncbi:MAG: DegT/DnrJ/EryC1/StrS family aminotransferase [Lachnospiraceae bacterium]|nr:DegT/DnrJ/EryC1/StrS family aminotransferase [Lachnospiraceae bacterium]
MSVYVDEKRFNGIKPLEKRAHLAIATPHEADEMEFIKDCYRENYITTAGGNVNALEKTVAEFMSTSAGEKRAVALSNGTAAIHLAVKLAAEKIYGSSTGISTPSGKGAGGALLGKRVFVTDMTFDASVNPILYEGGEPVFIDSEYETWNMDPQALRKAFEIYPDVKIVVFVHLYGVPGKIDECKKICEEYGALLIEDAAESLGAYTMVTNSVTGSKTEVPTGAVGDYGIISMNGNKIITGSSGGVLIVPDEYSYNKAKKWSTQSREAAPWYEHEELGYNYRISNIIAGVIRGQWPHLEEHISGKKNVYERYEEGLKDLPVTVHGGGNYWLSTLLIDEDAMAKTVRGDRKAIYLVEEGKSSPTEVLETLLAFNAEGRPIWKPLHLQPMYRGNEFITVNGRARGNSDAYIDHGKNVEVTTDIFNRGLCLPSDNNQTEGQAEVIIEVIKRCFL